MKDIQEKFIVTLCALAILSLLILLCTKPHYVSANKGQENVEKSNEQEGDEIYEQALAPEPQPRHLVIYRGKSIRYSEKFRDRNDLHLEAAHRIGLSHGPASRADAAKMKNQLREIKTNDYYVVEELTHSVPYLVPTAASRLDSIGKEFYNILQRNDLPHYRFRVTSVLRSDEDIRRLQRCNHNSIANSAHNYGTTFDIGYWHYDKVTQTCDSMTDDNLKLVLAQTLLNQQRAGHIYVKYEYKQCCFHITARD